MPSSQQQDSLSSQSLPSVLQTPRASAMTKKSSSCSSSASSTSSSSSSSAIPSLPLLLLIIFPAVALLLLPGSTAYNSRYVPKPALERFLQQQEQQGRAALPKGAAGFFGQQMPSSLRQAFERRDAANAELVRRASDVKVEAVENGGEEAATGNGAGSSSSSRIPRANNAKFARKNCFFSPLQCSFYYKSNSNFANVLMRGDELN